jgi:hypothetical protein
MNITNFGLANMTVRPSQWKDLINYSSNGDGNSHRPNWNTSRIGSFAISHPKQLMVFMPTI